MYTNSLSLFKGICSWFNLNSTILPFAIILPLNSSSNLLVCTGNLFQIILGLGILILLVMIYFVVKLDDDEREKWLKEHQEKSKGADVNTVKRL